MRIGMTLGALGALLLSPAAAAAPAGSALDGWTMLRLEGRKFLFARGIAEVERWPGGEGPLEVAVRSEARVFGARAGRHLAVSWVDRARGGSLRWIELSAKGRARAGRILPDGSCYEAAKYDTPTGKEAADRSRWRLAQQQRWPLPDEPGALAAVEPYALLGTLDRLLAAGRARLLLLTSRGPVPVDSAVTGHVRERLRLREGERGRRRSFELELARIELSPVSGGGETLLGMSGRTVLWVDAGSGALVRIEGRHEKLGGRIELELERFAKGPRPRPAVPDPLPAAPPTPGLDAAAESP